MDASFPVSSGYSSTVSFVTVSGRFSPMFFQRYLHVTALGRIIPRLEKYSYIRLFFFGIFDENKRKESLRNEHSGGKKMFLVANKVSLFEQIRLRLYRYFLIH